LSSIVNVPVLAPSVCGVKLTGNTQDAPAASAPAEVPAAINGQSGVTPLASVKPVPVRLALFPEGGTSIASAKLPSFETLTICGLSPLVLFTMVFSKLTLLAPTATSRMRLEPSAI